MMTQEKNPKKKLSIKDIKFSNVYKSVITTILGIVILLGSLCSSILFNNPWSDAIWGIAIGVGFLFAPDEIIEKLKAFIK